MPRPAPTVRAEQRGPGSSRPTGAAPRAGGRSAVLLLAVGLLLPAAAGAAADTPDALPGVTQLRRDAEDGQNGCLPRSTRGSQLTPWAQAFLRPDRVWLLSQGEGVTVAVLGSGVEDGNGLLTGRLDRAPLPGGADPAQDCVGHGTFLADLIAADRREGTGFAGFAPRARILAVPVTDGTGVSSPDLLARGITAAVDRGARVLAVGVALPAGSDALAAAVRAARDRGALVVAPAAPDSVPFGSSGPGPAYPAAYPEVLAVRDLAPGGALPGSSSSAAVGGRVDLAAPGDGVTGPGAGPGGHYIGTGPSYATAFVAATAALVLGYRPGLTADGLTRRLEDTAYRSTDPGYGHGTVDPIAAVTRSGEAAPGTPLPAAAVVMPPARPATHAPAQAVLVALAALGGSAVVAAAVAAVPRARGRGRRPGQPAGE
ncbi:S8 family serine peptidase [Kitasatospora terrestris]|uniref:Peptidase S8/S53 domain-containing protein n=1 Tax=Kitasatospora terrestris TaxID=258051 RepID=A0ABP9EK51_9ACTN